MKQLKIDQLPVIHAEVTLGLRLQDGRQRTTRDVTIFLQELNRQRLDAEQPQITFKVFSGYAPYIQRRPGRQSEALAVVTEEVTENVALLHLDYNPAHNGEERFMTLGWYVEGLLRHFEQTVAYAHVLSEMGHAMLVYALVDSPDPDGELMAQTEKTPAN